MVTIRGMRIPPLFFLALAFIFLPFADLPATPVLPGDILITTPAFGNNGTIREFTPTGLLVQTFTVPVPAGGDDAARDIAVDPSGRVEIWNGTFKPFLTTLTPGLLPGEATYHSNTLAGWSTVNNTQYGGIAVGGSYAYVTDMFTFNGGEANGIIRFDLATFQPTRFLQGTSGGHGDYIDLNLGLDGLLYALYPGGSPSGHMLDVIDPQSMTLLRTLNLATDLDAIAVDQAGNIYATSPFNPRIFRFNATGMLTGSLVTGSVGLDDLDLSADGRLLTVSTAGTVIISDTTLTTQTSFNIGSSVSFFSAFVPVPEPRTSILLLLAILIAPVLLSRKHAR